MDHMEAEKSSRRGHPLLRGGMKKETYSHGFSRSQMEVLSAMCEAFIPALSAEEICSSDGKEDTPNKHLIAFYAASACQSPVPDEVADLMVRRGQKEGNLLVKIVLWMLGFRLGTLLLCGSSSFSERFPFINKFSDMSVEKREEVLLKWSRARLRFPLRITFLMVKIFCCFIFYSMTNEKSENPSWKAIGYSLLLIKNQKSPRKAGLWIRGLWKQQNMTTHRFFPPSLKKV
ncbi:hypothetical protein HPP92_008353 [Vanilla planifolia]|uniref:Uncharacterized protein n=1 Tax=Vanilla planifolia TaxID=51239 RepID=A0A835RH48_VANPL|nr:hypothetical protein HPP92_008353 [Vanilla planifolia]